MLWCGGALSDEAAVVDWVWWDMFGGFGVVCNMGVQSTNFPIQNHFQPTIIHPPTTATFTTSTQKLQQQHHLLHNMTTEI